MIKILKTKKNMFGVTVLVLVVVAVVIFLTFSKSSDADIISSSSGSNSAGTDNNLQSYDYTQAPKHIGESTSITGEVKNIFTAKSGVTFFDYCDRGKTCPFSVVIFASDLLKFKNLKQYQRQLEVTGIVRSYQGQAEMVLNDPGQVK